MYTGLLHSHSFLRYAILILLVVVIVTTLIGWLNKKPYTKAHDKLGLYLFIATHLQLLLGIILYTQSDWVNFGKLAMKVKAIRYWTVEHVTIMLIAVALITMARITAKKLSSDAAKHQRMFIFNTLAFALIITGIVLSGRGII